MQSWIDNHHNALWFIIPVSHQSSLKASLQVRPLILPAGSGIASLNFQLNILRVPLDGPQPIGGWGTLTPGGSYSFCKTVDLANAMREPGKYAIWWKGENFQSVPVTVQVRHQ